MRPVEDTYRHKGLRSKLVTRLKEKGISDESVLDAINEVPRHFFLDLAFDEVAYEDRAFPILEGQTISHPYTVAYQSQLLNVQRFDKILEVGTGSAYQAVVLAQMGAKVFTIERQKALFDANKNFKYLKTFSGIKFFYGDGFLGLPTYAPFDKVLITAAAPIIPEKLLEQLKVGGSMVIPLGAGDMQQMKRLTKLADGSFNEEIFDNFSFVPMLSGKQS
jgi:protein-L-isoaspartate(D-aspartate) O-methyltransferase